jgi:hypothetical protein
VDGNGHGVVVDVVAGALVEVVTDARPVTQEVLHGDAIVDQRQVVAEDRARRRRQREGAVLDERHHGEGGEPLVAAGQREAGLGRVGDAPAPVRPPVRGIKLDRAGALDAHHA